MQQREERAFDNMRKAIDMHEAFERISINNHKSFLPHIAIFKVRTAHLLCRTAHLLCGHFRFYERRFLKPCL